MKIWIFACAILFSVSAQASDRWIVRADIDETLVDTSLFGQCMIKLPASLDIQDSLPVCRPSYLTFDCGAQLPNSTRINSLQKFESAVMAHALNRTVTLLVTDSQTINGYCFVKQIRVNSESP